MIVLIGDIPDEHFTPHEGKEFYGSMGGVLLNKCLKMRIAVLGPRDETILLI